VTTPYERFLESKAVLAPTCGFEVADSDLNPMLFPFQRDITRWALKRGKSAVFAHTGLGKGPIQMEWGAQVSKYARRPVLIVAPLAVAQQFMGEAQKFGYLLTLCKSQSDVCAGLNVTNYERLHLFDLSTFAGVSLDESSCIKDWTSKTSQTLIERLKDTPYKLCSTATPSPNDHSELGTHAELLDVMQRPQMLAMFFEHSGKETAKWTLKGHGRKPFFKFVASWAVCVVRPSDLGYDDTGYDLPKLHMIEHVVPVDQSIATEGMLFRCPDLSSTGLHKEMRLTCENRAAKVAELVNAAPGVPWLVWCNTDYEADALKAALPEIVEVRGPEKPDAKEAKLIGFARGEFLEMCSKPEIAGWGMNYQHCWNMAFVGLSYSFESMFQAIRRCWRFGQLHEVNAHIVYAETEGPVLQTIRRKERQYEELQSEMNAAMREEQLAQRAPKHKYKHTKRMKIPKWLKTENECAL
jgi:hypothetical protein